MLPWFTTLGKHDIKLIEVLLVHTKYERIVYWLIEMVLPEVSLILFNKSLKELYPNSEEVKINDKTEL